MVKSTFFSVIHWGIDAVNGCPELSIHFPTSSHDLKVVELEYQNKSSNGLLDGCIGALDGWLCHVQVPAQKETSNISAYFSRHYQCYGVNVQDAAYTLTTTLFIPFSGGDKKRKDNDAFSFHLSQLKIKIEQSFGFMVNGESLRNRSRSG